MRTITFNASFPPIQSAFQTGSDGARIKLDIAESDMAEAFQLIAFGRNKVMRITVEINEQEAD